MSQSPSSGDGDPEQGESDDLDVKKSTNAATCLKQNKKKLQEFEDEIEALTNSIRDLEVKQKSLSVVPDSKVQAEIRGLQTQRQGSVDKRRRCDEALRKVKQDLAKQNTEMTRVESTLKYKREDRTTETINRLEQQLKLRNFSLSEEKRIVAEIDALKRSKRALGQYSTLKREVDTLQERARILRTDVDRFYSEARTLKQKEDKLRQQMIDAKVKGREIKKELDVLYNNRRTLTAELTAAKKELQHQRDEQRRRKHKEVQRRKEEGKLHAQEEYEKEMKEYVSTHHPNHPEIQLCNTLISYLHRFVSEADATTERAQAAHGSDNQRDAVSPIEEGVYMLKKKTDENLFEGIVRPKTRKQRKDKRRSLSNKPMNHSPETFEQFLRLDLRAPVTTVDVLAVLSQLDEKKRQFEESSEVVTATVFTPPNKEDDPKEVVEKYLESLPPPAGLPFPCDSQYDFPALSASATTTTTDQRTPTLTMDQCTPTLTMDVSTATTSNTRIEVCSIGPESAICEDSIPNTPEVALDNAPPKFLPASSPTLSYDSGAPSLDHESDAAAVILQPSSPAPSENSTLIPDESPSPVESRSDSLEETRSLEGGELAKCRVKDSIDQSAAAVLCGDAGNNL